MFPDLNKYKIPLYISFGLILLFAVIVRFYHITDNTFIYYDEGMWLNNQRVFLTLVEQSPPDSLSAFFKFLTICFNNALATGKALWAFLVSLRVLVVGVEGWYFARLISAVFGVLSLGVVYCFTKKFYDSRNIAFLSFVLLAVFPSHVYYSRLALQESLSIFLFLAAFYFYIFEQRINWKVICSSFLFSLVYFANYRMIITPAIMLFAQCLYSLSFKERIPLKKWFIHSLVFAVFVFGVGSLNSGANIQVTFGWMFHQSHLAKGHFDWVNLLSYPYYIFHFETFIFGLLFFGNVYFIIKQQWKQAFAFLIVLFCMGIFSLPQEKGVRYLCVVMPFMVMSVAVMIDFLFKKDKKIISMSVFTALFIMIGMQIFESVCIAGFQTDYERSMNLLSQQNGRVISSQAEVQKLFAQDNKGVITSYPNLEYLLASYTRGYRFLVLDPQSYISYTEDGKRFSTKLKGVFSFIYTQVKPIRVYPHFNQKLLDRFVMEHNENLRNSLQFLKENKNNEYGKLYVYDLSPVMQGLQKYLKESK